MKIRVGFGLGVVACAGLDGPALLSILDRCEDLGWDSIWFSERITAGVPDPLAAMAATAARTRRLRFGTSVLVLPGRNPVLLAKELATIDVLSEGRMIVAVGLGAPVPEEHGAFLVDRAEAPGRTEEAVVLIKRLWTEERVTHEGRYFRVRDVALGTRPVQRPHPAVWFGGHSRPALRRVGRLGDGWLPSFVAPSEYKGKADAVRAAAAEAGREVEEGHYGALVAYVPDPAPADAGPILAAVAARRPDLAPDEVVVTGGHDALRARLESFVVQGASKFVVVPLVRPRDWAEELSLGREAVAAPLET